MEKLNFDRDWLFRKDGSDAVVPVTLPHNAMLYECRSADNPSGAACAYFSGGLYHYTKRFFVPKEWERKTAALYFESVEGGELLGFGSANPRTEESYLSGTFKTYYGFAQAIIRAGAKGTMTISADDGIIHCTKQIQIQEELV